MKQFYLLILFICTSLSVQANIQFSNQSTQEVQTSTDGVICDILVNGTSMVGFTEDVLVYSVTIPYNSPVPTVSIIQCDTTMEIVLTIIDPEMVPGTTLVTAENVTYYINWSYGLPSDDATLDSLFTDFGIFCWAAEPTAVEVNGSIVVLDVGDNSTAIVDITALPSHPFATYFITGSASVDPYGSLIIQVTAQDGITTQDYEVSVQSYCPMGLDENELDLMVLSPIPAQNHVNIQLNKSFSSGLVLRDLSGRTLYTIEVEEGMQNYQLDVSNYPSGMYFMELYQGGQKLQSEKLIIE